MPNRQQGRVDKSRVEKGGRESNFHVPSKAREGDGTPSSTTPAQIVISRPISPASVTEGQHVQASVVAINAQGVILTSSNGVPVSVPVTWTSSNTAIATVDGTGLITGVGVGSCTITAADGSLTASIPITVVAPPFDSVPAFIVIAPDTGRLVTPATLQLTAVVQNAAGLTIATATVSSWASSDSTIARVDSTGLVTAVGAGTANITASITSPSVTSNTSVVVVTVPFDNVPASIVITPSTISLQKGTTTTVSASVLNAEGQTIQNAAAPTFSSSNPTDATVSQSGVVSGVAVGSSNITATSGAATSNTAGVTVVDNIPASIAVTPSSATVNTSGATAQLTATVKNAESSAIAVPVSGWNTSDATKATVSATGLVTGVGAGTCTITATITSPSITSNGVTITVQAPVDNTPSAITIAPATVSLSAAGATQQLTATVTNAEGVALQQSPNAWQSSNTAAATVNSSGLVTAVAPGSSNITATITSPALTSNTSAVTVPNPSSIAEPVFNAAAGNTLLRSESFDSYTQSTIQPTCGVNPPSGTIIDNGWGSCATSNSTYPDSQLSVVTGRGGTGKALHFHYLGIGQESHGYSMFGGPQAPANKTSVVQYWCRLLPDVPGAITDTIVAAKIKWLELWHGDPGNTRIEFATLDHAICPWLGPAYINWGVVDQVETLCDGVQPVGPTIGQVADGNWHRFTQLTKPNTSQGSRDGRALMWIDGTLVVRIEQSAVGVVAGNPNNPRTAGMPWCNQDDVDALCNGYGITHVEWGGPLTNGNTPSAIEIDDFSWWTQ